MKTPEQKPPRQSDLSKFVFFALLLVQLTLVVLAQVDWFQRAIDSMPLLSQGLMIMKLLVALAMVAILAFWGISDWARGTGGKAAKIG